MSGPQQQWQHKSSAHFWHRREVRTTEGRQRREIRERLATRPTWSRMENTRVGSSRTPWIRAPSPLAPRDGATALRAGAPSAAAAEAAAAHSSHAVWRRAAAASSRCLGDTPPARAQPWGSGDAGGATRVSELWIDISGRFLSSTTARGTVCSGGSQQTKLAADVKGR